MYGIHTDRYMYLFYVHFVLKVCGLEEYIIGEQPLIHFKVRDLKTTSLIALLLPSLPTYHPLLLSMFVDLCVKAHPLV